MGFWRWILKVFLIFIYLYNLFFFGMCGPVPLVDFNSLSLLWSVCFWLCFLSCFGFVLLALQMLYNGLKVKMIRYVDSFLFQFIQICFNHGSLKGFMYLLPLFLMTLDYILLIYYLHSIDRFKLSAIYNLIKHVFIWYYVVSIGWSFWRLLTF